MSKNLENSAAVTGLTKVSFHFNPKEGQCQRMFELLHNSSKVMLKILQARLQQYMKLRTCNVETWFLRGRGSREQIANIHWIIKKAREFQKNINSASLCKSL